MATRKKKTTTKKATSKKKKPAEEDPQNRDKTGKFVKGNRANPGGRPKIPDEAKIELRNLTPLAIKRVKEILTSSTDERVVLQAANSVLDRNLGKARQPIDLTEEAVRRMSDEQLMALLPEAIEAVQAAGLGLEH